MDPMEAHVRKMEAVFKQWIERFDEFVAKNEAAGSVAKVGYDEHIKGLKAKHKVAEAKLDGLKTASPEEWETFKADVDTAWLELEAEFKGLTQ